MTSFLIVPALALMFTGFSWQHYHPAVHSKPIPSLQQTTVTPTPAVPTTQTNQQPGNTSAPTPSVSEYALAIETAVHEKINAERVKNGLKPLSVDARLTSIARAHSKDMLENNYFSHTNQSGCSASCRYKNAGYSYRSMGENIYMMSGYTLTADQAATKIVQGWMNSSGHRANILKASYTVEGIGVAVEGKKIYATENFALPR